MNDSSWRSGSHHHESWRNSDIPLPPSERQALPSLMDPPEIGDMRRNIDDMRQKIIDSEKNLQLHRDGMDELLMAHWRVAIRTAENSKVDKLLDTHHLNGEELNAFFEQMSTPKCSKDLMAQAKRWIFDNCPNDQLREVILTYLLNKVKDESTGEYLRLHILYLINDWLFHCQRKREENQMKMLTRYVPKMYAYGIELSASPELCNKMENKLLGEWEGRKYLPETVVKQLRNTLNIVNNDRDVESSSYLTVKESIRSNLVATFEGYEQQHVMFSQHIQKQIDDLERKIDVIRNGPPMHSQMPPHMGPPSNLRRSRFDQAPTSNQFPSENHTWRPMESRPAIPIEEDIDGTPFNEELLKPKKSYMALPAGIMVPLVPMNSFTYEPLDPDDLEMPPAVPPSQRLLAAKNKFYKGIEIDMLAADGAVSESHEMLKYPTEYLDKKAQQKKEFLENQRVSLNDLITNKPTKADNERFDRERKLKEEDQIAKYRVSVDAYYGNQSPQPEPEETPKRQSPSRSPSRDRHDRRSPSRSPSRSPKGRRRRSRSRSRGRRSSSSSSSSSTSSSASSKSSRRSMDRERDFKQGSRGFRGPPSDRPSFGSFKSSHDPLPADNKGAQLMAKMGWTSGKGLGSNESGIVNPVSGGEVRDRNEQFMGFGRSLDQYEQFRKQRSGSYHERGSGFRK